MEEMGGEREYRGMVLVGGAVLEGLVGEAFFCEARFAALAHDDGVFAGQAVNTDTTGSKNEEYEAGESIEQSGLGQQCSSLGKIRDCFRE